MHIIFWFNTYSIIRAFSFSATFVERISGLQVIAFNYISPETSIIQNLFLENFNLNNMDL